MANDEWGTPPEIIEAVRKVLGSIDLDPATNRQAQKTVLAKQIYTKSNSGLDKPWGTLEDPNTVFLNPPYSQPLCAEFIDKLIHEFEQGNIYSAILLVKYSSRKVAKVQRPQSKKNGSWAYCP